MLKTALKSLEKSYTLHAYELPMVQLQDRTATKVWNNPLIPPVVYQTWQDNLFGKTHYGEIEKFRDLNSDLNFKLFDDKQVDLYMEEYWGNHAIREIYKQAKYGPMKSDIFRYCILCERGGLYFDINKGCKRLATNDSVI